jgi:hypothetical protein
MTINKGDILFIGNAGGICGYMWHGLNIIRKSTALTGGRVKNDAAFKGFRESGNRMKEASPIAASLYNLIPKVQRTYALYRILTGEALKMIKLGMDKQVIVEILKEQYIDPVIERPRRVLRCGLRSKRKLQFAAVDGIPYDSIGRSRENGLIANTGQQTTVMQADKKSEPPQLIYLGKFTEAKGLKMWLRPRT